MGMPQGKAGSGCQLFCRGQEQSSLETKGAPVTDTLPSDPRSHHLDTISVCLRHTEIFECLGESGKWEDSQRVLKHQCSHPANIY